MDTIERTDGSTDEISVEELCREIEARRRAKYQAKTKPYPRSNPIASDISDCMRETVLGITHWQDRPEFPVEAIQRMERGNQIENWMIRELMELGYNVRVDQQPFELKDKKGRVISRGKVDGFIQTGRRVFPLECKSMMPTIYAQINTQEDFDRYTFFRKYPRQLQSYLLANNLDQGFWIVDDLAGHWKLIPCHLDFGRAEKILQHVEGAVEHLVNGTLPDFHKDASVCLKCWAFKRVCTPPIAAGEGMQVIDDPELGLKLARIKELEEAHREYERYDKEVKKVFKATMKANQTFIIGDFMVSSSEEHERKGYEVKATKYVTFEIEKLPY